MAIEKLKIRIQRIRQCSHSQPLPAVQTQGASGCDLLADIEASLLLKPGERVLVPTGIAISLPKGFEAQVRPRSGWAVKHGLTVVNSPGTIDSDYRGEIKVLLINFGNQPVWVT